jgi:hypothetical protein
LILGCGHPASLERRSFPGENQRRGRQAQGRVEVSVTAYAARGVVPFRNNVEGRERYGVDDLSVMGFLTAILRVSLELRDTLHVLPCRVPALLRRQRLLHGWLRQSQRRHHSSATAAGRTVWICPQTPLLSARGQMSTFQYAYGSSAANTCKCDRVGREVGKDGLVVLHSWIVVFAHVEARR